MIKNIAVACLALALAACGDTIPTLTQLQLSAASVKSGQMVVATALLEDAGLDLDGGKQEVTLTPSNLPPVLRELPINLGGSARRASISLSIDTSGLPQGTLKIDLQVIDKSGKGSNVVSATVVIT